MARPFRYTFILGIVGLCTALAAVGGWRYARASAPVNGPIIMVSVDSLRADRLPVYGYRAVQTPAIDALAADGVVFERAYAHAPQTLPAHTALLSGRLPFATGVRDAAGFVVKPDERMLAEMLRDRGYATAGIVSSYALRKDTGIAQGFSFFDDELPEPSAAAATPAVERDGMQAERLAEAWLARWGGARTFLFLHVHEPHAPHAAPTGTVPNDPYDAEVAYVDEIMGRLVKYLKDHQLYDQSTIVLLADHGEGLGDHGEQTHGLLVYEETVRVPLVIKQAAGVGAGRRVRELVQHVDLVPTILDLARAPIPGDLHGRSLKPLLEDTGDLGPRVVYSESLHGRYRFGWSAIASVVDGRYRYIRTGRDELYDLESDPAQRHDVAASHPEVVERLRTALERVAAGPAVPKPAPIDDVAYARLQALGSIGVAMPRDGGQMAPVNPHDEVARVERYRSAMADAQAGSWTQAIAALVALSREEPPLDGVLSDLGALALRAGRYELALDAHTRAATVNSPAPYADLGAATALLRLRRFDDARDRATRAAAALAGTKKADAHELLARIALARRDVQTARAEAARARTADPGVPLPSFVEGRVLFDDGEFEAALEMFQQAAAELQTPAGAPRTLADLHYYTAEALVHLDRHADAEEHYVEELKAAPHNTRARAALATLYQRLGRTDDARGVVADLLRITPTPETFALAGRLFAALGDSRAAADARARGRRAATAPPAGTF